MIDEEMIRFESVTVSLLQLRVWVGERPVHFTLTELRILLIFLQEPYRTISMEEILRRTDLTSRGQLHQLVSRLRDLVGQGYIFTEPGGYTFARIHRRIVPPLTNNRRGHHVAKR